MRFIRLFVLVVAVVSVCGCVNAGIQTSNLFGIPSPTIDQTLHSVQYYSTKYKYDCLSKRHDMRDEIDSEHRAAETANKVYSRIKIMGVSPQAKPKTKLYTSSKKLSENNYFIACSTKFQFEKQFSPVSCWASCSQYLIRSRYKVSIPQEAIVEKIKKGVNPDDVAAAGEVIDIVRALGFGGLTYTKDGSWQLLESLAENQPVMIGLLPKDGEATGHAVVVIGARYSFASSASPPCLFCSTFAFSEFVVLDPADGQQHVVDAQDYEGRVYFVLSYYNEI